MFLEPDDNRNILNIAFAPPYIDDDVIAEVVQSLKSGWITSGPKVRELESLTAEFLQVKKTICVNSWSSGAALALKWLGVGKGDEVIIPAYTYAATALAVLHAGAKPVMVDVLDDFTIDPQKIADAITPATKAIIPVDIGGWPCNYDAIRDVVNTAGAKEVFSASNKVQENLGRIAIISDSAHSLGATYNNLPVANATDIALFSLNAVKNITTAEGGIIALNLPAQFDTEEVFAWMKLNSLNGQTKDAFAKTKSNEWRYDIISDGIKANMPDICAAVGLAQLRKYGNVLMNERERIIDHYTEFFSKKPWAILPPTKNHVRNSSFHLFQLRINGFTETMRDQLIAELAKAGVNTNVHFIPLPMLTLFKESGYDIANYPTAYKNYAHEISLPIYPQLTDEECSYIEQKVEEVYLKIVQ